MKKALQRWKKSEKSEKTTMVKLQELLNFYKWEGTHVDMKKISELEQDGLVQMKKHPEYPLFLLNYTAKTQFKQRWCKELIYARGLVITEDGEIIARPLPKFFNYYEITDLYQLQDNYYELYDKMDGSLGIMFYYENERIFCTRGSFISDQAEKSEELFKSKYNNVNINKECTYCFEVIYPENKIVVDYDELEDLFLISITHTKTGKDVNIENTGFKIVNKLETNGLSFSDLLQYDIPNKEGYVVKFNYLRVKIKFDNYIVRHKRKTLSMNAIKRSMKKMERINLDNIPDECHSEVREIMHEMEEEFNNKKHMIVSEYMNIVKVNDSERDVIDAIKQSIYASILFPMYRGKPYDKLIWKLL